MSAMMHVFVWGDNACPTGMFPFEDIYGDSIPGAGKDWLAGGWRGVLTEIKGDLEFYKHMFEFPRWDQALNMCFVCGARWTHEGYISEIAAGRLKLPTVFEAIGLRVECVMIDVLHTVDQVLHPM